MNILHFIFSNFLVYTDIGVIIFIICLITSQQDRIEIKKFFLQMIDDKKNSFEIIFLIFLLVILYILLWPILVADFISYIIKKINIFKNKNKKFISICSDKCKNGMNFYDFICFIQRHFGTPVAIYDDTFKAHVRIDKVDYKQYSMKNAYVTSFSLSTSDITNDLTLFICTRFENEELQKIYKNDMKQRRITFKSE